MFTNTYWKHNIALDIVVIISLDPSLDLKAKTI